MKIHEKYGLTKIINAAGTFTPYGVSRSSPYITRRVADALGEFWLIEELQQAASSILADWSGAEAGAVTHCTASAITISIAATMTGTDGKKIAQLPDTGDMPDRVILPASHAVFYGQSILQAIRLAGAEPVLAGSGDHCSLADLQTELSKPATACLLLVSSRLVKGEALDHNAAIALAHQNKIPAIIDCAAQDMRLAQLVATRADLLLISAQKYLSAPTAGLIVGKKQLIDAVRANEGGIGRAMKGSKEAILGVLAAIEERQQRDQNLFTSEQDKKLNWFLEQANLIEGLTALPLHDATGLPFARACLTVGPSAANHSAVRLSEQLKAGSPSIRVMEYALTDGKIILELVPLDRQEIEIILDRLSKIIE